MLALEPIDPHWLESEDDPRDDQCAHGHVRFEIDGTILVSREDGELTLSAAALFLLRTLEHDHTAQSPVTEGSQLFPCCGFNVWLCGDRFPVMILGCPTGVDVEVRHVDGLVEFARGAKRAHVVLPEWERAVLSFVSSVEEFYSRSKVRNPIQNPEDAEGWEAFWGEWRARRDAHEDYH